MASNAGRGMIEGLLVEDVPCVLLLVPPLGASCSEEVVVKPTRLVSTVAACHLNVSWSSGGVKGGITPNAVT